MPLFEEEVVKGNSPYGENKIAEYEKGQSIGFMYVNEKTANSSEYGEFKVWQGVTFDPAAETEAELLKSLALGSIIPNMLLCNKQDNGAIIPGEMYRIEKAWNKGDTFDGNKKAKGHGYVLYHLKLSTAILKKVKTFHDEAMNLNVKEEESTDSTKGKPKI